MSSSRARITSAPILLWLIGLERRSGFASIPALRSCPFELLGVPFHERGAMSEGYIQAILALWTQEKPQFEGKYVSFRDVAFEPRPFRKPHLPVWFGGDADAVLKR
jgi:hypothetical protein